MRKSGAGRRNAPTQRAPLDAKQMALRLIATLGEAATCHATYQALKARHSGDAFLMDQWLWVAGATREILRTEPAGEG
jgi:hypothetical protein